MKIRSVTLFASLGTGFRERLIELGYRLSASIGSMFLTDSVWSTRAALPPIGKDESPMKRVFQLSDLDVLDYLSIGHIEDTHPSLEEVAEVAENGFFISINLSDISNVGRVLKVLRKTCENDSSNGGRVSVNIRESILTPYFPAACNLTGEEGLALSLLYPSLLRNKLLSQFEDILAEVYASTEKIGLRLSNELGVKYQGVDLSLSPWMDESVAEIIEFASGVKMPLPGTFSMIREINRLIDSAAKKAKVSVTGYNEVMLSVAEDDLLKERVANGDVKLRDLVHLTAACVAGVDMVVLPDEVSDSFLKNVFKDLFEIRMVKNRTIGIRILFAPADSGKTLKLKLFGETPVIFL
ncbi:MAG: DUF711 family protein [Thermoproteota archaeon]